MQIHFLTGMSRSGTTALMSKLNEHPDVLAFGETGFWGRHYIPDVDGRYFKPQLTHARDRFLAKLQEYLSFANLSNDDHQEIARRIAYCFLDVPDHYSLSPAECFTQFCQILSEVTGKQFILEKTPHHIMWLSRIRSHLPSAKFVSTVRSPYEFMLSYKHQGDRMAPAIRGVFARFYHPFGCAVVWRGYAAKINQCRRDDSVMIVDSSDLRTNYRTILSKICTHFGIPDLRFSPFVEHINSSFSKQSDISLKCEDYFWLNLVCRSRIIDAGYNLQSRGNCVLPIFYSIIRLPLWAARCFVFLASRMEGNPIRYLRSWIFPR